MKHWQSAHRQNSQIDLIKININDIITLLHHACNQIIQGRIDLCGAIFDPGVPKPNL